MKLKIKVTLLALSILALMALITGCAGEKTPYEVNDEENYTVSVKYDANGGIFTTNTSVIVDSYNIDSLNKNSDGQVEIALLSPDNLSRGNDAFNAVNNGHFLVGWYKQRIENVDAEGKTVYTYLDKWDFEKDLLKLDADGNYSSSQPVITLYAAWLPLFEIEFYSVDSGEYLESYTFDPTNAEELTVPAWNIETGTIDMYKFPERSGFTFSKAYYDKEASTPIDTNTVIHPGVINYETGTASDPVLKLYLEWVEGEWYHIYTTEQFLENASVNGCYEIHADLDFTDKIWPTSFMYNNFVGKINGNGHTMKNIEAVQTNNSKVNAGLFGYLTETSSISDITFENVNFTIKSGTRVVGTSYGLFAGTISNDATLNNVNILSSTLKIDSSCYFGVSDYSIGLVCGMGNADKIEVAEIECVVVGDDLDSMTVTVNGNTVTLNTSEQ